MHLSKVAQWVEDSVKNANASVTDMGDNVDKVDLPAAFAVMDSERAVGVFPSELQPHLGHAYKAFDGQVGYFNPQGGWAEANNATVSMLNEARRLGAEVVGNARVTSLIYAEPKYNQTKPKVMGVKTADGRAFYADRVVLAAGCWTSSLLNQLKLSLPRPVLKATAHCVLTLKLDPEVAKKFKGTPVTFNMYRYVAADVKTNRSGFYTFEPNADGILKCAIHGVRLLANPADRIARLRSCKVPWHGIRQCGDGKAVEPNDRRTAHVVPHPPA